MKTERLLKYGFVIPTGEYIGGVFAGLGLGVVITSMILSPAHVAVPLTLLIALGCVVIGSLSARAAQRKRFQKDSSDEKPVA